MWIWWVFSIRGFGGGEGWWFYKLIIFSLEIFLIKMVIIFGFVVNRKMFKREEVLMDGRYRNYVYNSG